MRNNTNVLIFSVECIIICKFVPALYLYVSEQAMLRISATKLRNNLFTYLDKVKAGEILIVLRNKDEAARIVPPHTQEWRDKMKVQPKLKVKPDELIQPMDDLWE